MNAEIHQKQEEGWCWLWCATGFSPAASGGSWPPLCAAVRIWSCSTHVKGQVGWEHWAAWCSGWQPCLWHGIRASNLSVYERPFWHRSWMHHAPAPGEHGVAAAVQSFALGWDAWDNWHFWLPDFEERRVARRFVAEGIYSTQAIAAEKWVMVFVTAF